MIRSYFFLQELHSALTYALSRRFSAYFSITYNSFPCQQLFLFTAVYLPEVSTYCSIRCNNTMARDSNRIIIPPQYSELHERHLSQAQWQSPCTSSPCHEEWYSLLPEHVLRISFVLLFVIIFLELLFSYLLEFPGLIKPQHHQKCCFCLVTFAQFVIRHAKVQLIFCFHQ